MAISADFTINSVANPARHETTYGATVNLALVNPAGIDTISWEVETSSDSGDTLPVITPGGSPVGATASFSMVANPGDGRGRTMQVKCTVASQYERVVSRGVVGVLNDAGNMPVCANEGKVRDATSGWLDELNSALNGGGTASAASANTYDTLRAKTPVAGQVHFVTTRGGGMFAAVIGASPSTYVDDDATVILPTGGDGSAAFLRIYTGSIWCEWLGAVGDDNIASATINTAAINAAIVLAKAKGADNQIGAGRFWINDTVLIDQCAGLKFTGAGSSDANDSVTNTTFIWSGAADRAALQIQDSRECQVRDIGIILNGATYPLYCGVRLYWAGVGPVMTRNRLSNVRIHGHSGYLGNGVLIDKASGAPDSNNSEHILDSVIVEEYGTGGAAAFSLPSGFKNTQSQAKAIQFIKCAAVATVILARAGSHGVYSHGSYTWINGGGGFNAVSAFHISSANDCTRILGHNSEQDVRLMTTGSGQAAANTYVDDVRYDTWKLHADGRAIKYTMAGTLALNNSTFTGNSGFSAENVYFEMGTSGGPSHISVHGGSITSKAHPIVTKSGATVVPPTYEFANVHGVNDAGVSYKLPDRSLSPVASVMLSGTGSRNQPAGGLARPTTPVRHEMWVDEYLKRPIFWDPFGAAWVYSDGTAAAAGFTPDLAGTLVGAWHFDEGVTESGLLVSNVTGKFGTSPALVQASGPLQLQLELLKSGRYAVRGLDASDMMIATLAAPLAHRAWIYVVGEWVAGSGVITSTGLDRMSTKIRATTFDPAMHAGSNVGTGTSAAAYDARAFVGKWDFNDASSAIRIEFDGLMTANTATGLAPGTDDGNTAFHLGAFSGDGAMVATSMVLLYTTEPDETYLSQYLKEWGGVTIV